MNNTGSHTAILMGTVVTIEVVGCTLHPPEEPERQEAIERAFGWFRRVEETCNRFDEQSELRQLSAQIGTPAAVSDLLFEVVRFSLAVAGETGGAFDPTVGHRMEGRGFNRNYRTGLATNTLLPSGGAASHGDVRLDPVARTITLLRPLLLDLGAVAKGLAIDLAARELQPFANFAIYAGGDLYLGGQNKLGQPWSVGIRHPRDPQELIETIRVSDLAVCTSGDYERRTADPRGGHHLMDPRTGGSATACASVTVVARSAMLADGLATAAFVLGPVAGRELLERHGVDGLIITPALERFATRGMRYA